MNSLILSCSIPCNKFYELQNFISQEFKAKQKKIYVFPVTCFLQLGYVGRIIFYFLQKFCLPEVRFYKNRTAVSTFFSPIAPSFSMANSLISSDMLSTVRERYKNTLTKVTCIFNIGCNRNRLETENTFLREESVVRNQKRQ